MDCSEHFYLIQVCCLSFVFEQCCNMSYLVSCFNYVFV
uniref:Uncharacterized protein n=1 Tax=Arundo donax TaxID=35708 RepID=A0A0A8Z6L7_ARUDO